MLNKQVVGFEIILSCLGSTILKKKRHTDNLLSCHDFDLKQKKITMMSYSYASTNNYQQVLVEFINALNLPLMTVPDCKRS